MKITKAIEDLADAMGEAAYPRGFYVQVSARAYDAIAAELQSALDGSDDANRIREKIKHRRTFNLYSSVGPVRIQVNNDC